MNLLKKSRLTNCKKCTLDGIKVYGEIGEENGALFLGEAPGRTEVAKKKVFVGSAGKNFDKILKMAYIKRKCVTIINTVLCRPPKNRDPSKLELLCCRKRVLNTIRKVSPAIIVILGRIAFRSLFKRQPDKEDRFKRLRWRGICVRYIYHPAYFAYNPDFSLMQRCADSIHLALEGEKWNA